MTRRSPFPWRAISCLALILAAASLLFSVILYARTGDDALRACQRANDVRRQINPILTHYQLRPVAVPDCRTVVKSAGH